MHKHTTTNAEGCDGDGLVGVQELARRIGVSCSWVRQKAASGELPHYRRGSLRRFDANEILSLMRHEAAGDSQVGSAG